MRDVWEVLDPSAIPSSRSGAGSPSSRKNTAESSSSKCWPVCTRTSSCWARSGSDTAAALMNCGRLPTTVRTLNGSSKLGADPLPDERGDARGLLAAFRERVVVDGGDGLDLAHGRAQER